LRIGRFIKELRQDLNQLVHGRIKISAVLRELLVDGHGGDLMEVEFRVNRSQSWPYPDHGAR
jgi:hypothetical protein